VAIILRLETTISIRSVEAGILPVFAGNGGAIDAVT
jgi:hypothetical protein